MDAIIIREAVIEDCAGIQYIHRDCNDPWHDAVECASWLTRRLARGFYIQAAVIGRRIVGHGEWIVTDSPDGRFLYLGMLQVDSDFQRLGVGRKMIDDGVLYAKANNCSAVRTIPDSDNTSEVFYEKCGFIKKRAILRCVLSTCDELHFTRSYEAVNAVPFSLIAESPLVFGMAQASSRHMWEVNNQKPDTDDRLSPAARFDDGSCAQLVYFPESKDALALYWSNTPDKSGINNILCFGKCIGMEQIEFLFFDEYAFLFEGNETAFSDIEMEKVIL